ncbi:MAG: FUSC family protein [Gordonia sp. (in: high G+C Gram-positive bacteria)]|uniref:FUSC family protein n=1 Tax=Gordonia sp. (in: high G+C Gram-positive bacteria) TaxID=84139 RepID=UPI0039E5E5B8
MPIDPDQRRLAAERLRARRSSLINRFPAAVQKRIRRLGLSALPILQCAIAAGLAWFVAHDVLHHNRPFFAPIAAVISLGVALNKRWRRAIELVGGVIIGIIIGDVVVSLIGSGAWQISVVVAIAMAVAVFADGAVLAVNQAASSAILVATLIPPGGSATYERAFDAVIGGGLGLLIAALMPVNPTLRARRDAAGVLTTLRDLSRELAASLRSQDVEGVGDVLKDARATQAHIDAMHNDMRAGRDVAAMSPLYWGQRPRLKRIADAGDPIDNAMRNFRVCSRRARGLTQRGVQVEPAVISLIESLPEGFDVLREMMLAPPGGYPDGADAARVLRSIVRSARPAVAAAREAIADGGDISELALLVELRSILVDMLMVAGLKRESAIAQLRLD